MNAAVVKNVSSTVVQNWGAHVRLTNAVMTSSWNGEVTGTGTHYSVAPPSWGATIQPGQTVTTFGFCASARG